MCERMQEGHPVSKFAFILHADVVGSTVLVQQDERIAHERIQAAFQRLVETITSYGGVAHEVRGDALVAEFEKASDAVCAALRFQQDNTSHNAGLSDPILVQLRIGIAMGEVVIENHTVTGAGVVLAQRLEQLAVSGGVVVQGAVHEAIPARLPFEYHSLGEQSLKGFDEPVAACSVSLPPEMQIPLPQTRSTTATSFLQRTTTRYAMLILAAIGILAGVVTWWQPWRSDAEPASIERMVQQLPDKPSIAVLPFDNISGDPEQEYFSDGISEDIITDLSRLSNLSVIARNSSFTYKGRSVKVQQIGEDLGVQYVLEGSVRKAGKRIRITAQLVDTSTGHHLWAQRYDREQADVFELQDDITEQIVSALSIHLSDEEKRNIGRVVTNSFEAYDLFLRAQGFANRYTREGGSQTIELYEQAIRLDPVFARAYGALAVVLARQILRGMSENPVEMSERALSLARKAESIDPKSPHVQWALGYVYMYKKEFDKAIESLQKAVSISPNFADGYGLLALINNNLGNADEAIQLIEKGIKLNPYYSWDYPYNLGRANYALGEYQKAVNYLEQALERNPAVTHPKFYLASSLIQLGRQDDAEWVITELAMGDAEYSISHLQNVLPIGNSDLLDRLLSDLRAAGLPE